MMGSQTRTLSLLLHGHAGRMGQTVRSLAETMDDIELLGGLDFRERPRSAVSASGCPTFDHVPEEREADAVIAIDFSSPDGVSRLIQRLRGTGVRVVCGTTGLGTDEWKLLQEYSKEQAVFYDENMSYGISVLKSLLASATQLLRGVADVEIIEYHHRHKRDHPSGTALALARVIDPKKNVREGRSDHGTDGAIHVHSLRIGGVPGEHQVIFGTDEEVLTLSHRAISRAAFARGAIAAARFLSDYDRGLFTMEDILRSRRE